MLAQTAAPAASAPPAGLHKSRTRHTSSMSRARARTYAKLSSGGVGRRDDRVPFGEPPLPLGRSLR
jgi:hypothetical protein